MFIYLKTHFRSLHESVGPSFHTLVSIILTLCVRSASISQPILELSFILIHNQILPKDVICLINYIYKYLKKNTIILLIILLYYILDLWVYFRKFFQHQRVVSLPCFPSVPTQNFTYPNLYMASQHHLPGGKCNYEMIFW